MRGLANNRVNAGVRIQEIGVVGPHVLCELKLIFDIALVGHEQQSHSTSGHDVQSLFRIIDLVAIRNAAPRHQVYFRVVVGISLRSSGIGLANMPDERTFQAIRVIRIVEIVGQTSVAFGFHRDLGRAHRHGSAVFETPDHWRRRVLRRRAKFPPGRSRGV